MTSLRQRPPRWLTVALGAGAMALIVLAALIVGAPGQASSGQARIVKARNGVVQSTVSGSGNIQPATQLDLGFKTAGVVQRIYVTQGQYVTPGKLIAELNPQSAEVALEQAKATLQAAEAALVQQEESGGETSSGSTGASGSGVKTTTATSAGYTMTSVALTSTSSKTTLATPTSGAKPTSTSKAPSTSTTKTPTTSTGSAPSTSGSSTASPEKATQSAATKEANLASARAAVKSDRLAVQSGEQSVANTKLYAPTNGTVVSLSGEVGENVSAAGTTKASTAASSSSAGTSGSGATGASATGRSSSTTTSSASSSSSSSTTAFAVLSDLGTMQLVVPLSESEVVQVHVGQPATVTVEALEGTKLAAHVVSIATLSTSNSGVVSYPVTFQLDQAASNLKPGMSASAEVVVKQAEGINVPTSAISGKAVTVVRGGKRVRVPVVTGLAGNSSTIILSGLSTGDEVVLPVASTGGGASITSKLGGRGGGGLGGGGFPGAGAGAFAGGGRPGGG
jgi:multidrug efflux pump subunit AcrA (membrane-fusion protein)